MAQLPKWWKNIPSAVRKPLVLIVGSLVVLGGVALLPLPGPGWVVIFLGFAVLATEFEFAERVRDWLVNFVKKLIAMARSIFKKNSNKH